MDDPVRSHKIRHHVWIETGSNRLHTIFGYTDQDGDFIIDGPYESWDYAWANLQRLYRLIHEASVPVNARD